MTESTLWQNPDDEQLKDLLTRAQNIAVVGCSPKPDRTSHQITKFLIEQGYNVFPIHPQADEILGQPVYKTLADVPEPIDIVDVFRKAEFTPPVAEAAAACGAKTLWLQQGIINEEAWDICQQHEMNCIMDLCIAVMHRMLIK